MARRSPALGLFGSDQAVMARRRAAGGDCALSIEAGDAPDRRRVARMMQTTGAAMVRVALPDGFDRAEVA